MPVLAQIKAWMIAEAAKVSRKSEMAKAINCSLTRWDALVTYTTNGKLEIDNNAAERSVRAIALSRKNCMFAGSDEGGKRAAALYSLIGTAKMHGQNPEPYLRDVLARINVHKIKKIDALLPWNMKPEIVGDASD